MPLVFFCFGNYSRVAWGVKLDFPRVSASPPVFTVTDMKSRLQSRHVDKAGLCLKRGS